MAVTIEQLELEVQSSSTSAVNGLEALSASLGKVREATKGGMGLANVAKRLQNLNTALNTLDTANFNKLDKAAASLEKLQRLGELKISSSIAKQLSNIGSAASTLSGTDFTGIGRMANALTSLNNITASAGLGKTVSQFRSLVKILPSINSVDWGSFRVKMENLVMAFKPLATVNIGTGLSSAISQLNKLPKVYAALNTMDWSKFATQMSKLSSALNPLANKIDTVGNAFSRLPANIKAAVAATDQISPANNAAGRSYTNLWAKLQMAKNAFRGIAGAVAGWINQSNQYVEDINLFDASMGEYAKSASEYAEKVGELMGIDPGEFMRNQGTFNTIISGFGVASDKAYLMSQNLTQLGYDLASFFNIPFENAMEKVQSGISGELEPMRRLGYDLSVARLQEEALALGINKKVSAMTQAEKSQLRYHAMLTQVTTAQGDMARTLNAPANQLRVLQAQLTQCARALGNIFIPALNAVLPYVIAVTKAVRALAESVAKLLGFELPEVDYSGLNNVASAATGASDAMESATDTANKLKRSIMGFDELNVLQKDTSSSAGTDSAFGSNDLGIDLPSYDFIGNAVSSRVDDAIQKMKEWLGITEEIKNLNDLLHTRLGRILTTVGAIGAGLAAWKISNGVISGLKYLQGLKNSGLGNAMTIAIGVSLLVTGVSLEWAGIIDAVKNELNGMNFSQIVSGALLTVPGAAFLGSGFAKWVTTAFKGSGVANAVQAAAANLGNISVGTAGAVLGAGIGAVIAGIPMYLTGIWDALKNGLNWLNGLLIPTGSTLAGAGIGAICAAAGTAITPGIGTIVGLLVGVLTDEFITIGKLIYDNWDVIKADLRSRWESAKSWWSSSIVPFFQTMGDGIKTALDNIKGFFIEKWTAITDFVNGIPEKIGNVMTSVQQWFTDKWTAITDFMGTVPEKIGTAVTAVGQWFSELPGKIGYALGYALGSVVQWAGNLKTAMEQSVSQAVTSAVQWFSALPERISAALNTAITAITTWGTNVYNSVSTSVSNAVTAAGNWFSALPERISVSISSTYERITAWGTEVTNRFNMAAATAITSVLRQFTELAGKISSAIGTCGDVIAKWGTDMVQRAKTAAANVVKTVVTGIKELPGKLRELGKDIVQGFLNGLTDAWRSITDAVKNFVDGFVNGFKNALGIHSPSTVFQSIGTNVVAGLQNGLQGLSSVFTTAFSTIRTWLGSFGHNMYTWGSEMMGNMVSGISSGLNSLKDKVASAASTIRSYLHFSQPDVGPLADFNTWMPDMMSQLAGGIAKDEDKVRKQVEHLAGTMNLAPTMQANVTAYSGTPTANAAGDNSAALSSAVYSAVLAALNDNSGGEDGGTPIVINLGNEQIASFLVKQNRRNALISGGKA